MNEKNPADTYCSQGEYVTYFDKDFISVDMEKSLSIRKDALEIAKANNVKPRKKNGGGISRGRVTITLPKRIWKEAYNNLTQ